MPYMAVRCSSCNMLQEVRKSTSSKSKWSCVICNQKQSLRKVYVTSNSSKEVRKFVQNLNLSMGLAAEEDAVATAEGTGDLHDLPSASFLPDHEENRRYQEEEGSLELVANGRGRKHWSSCAQDWATEEDCIEDSALPQSSQGDKIADSWCDYPGPARNHLSRERSHALPPRTLQSLSAVKDCSAPGRLRSADSEGQAGSRCRTENLLLKLKRGRNSGSDNRTTARESFRISPEPNDDSHTEIAPDADCLPNRVNSMHNSMHNSMPGAVKSKWSIYLD